MDPGQFIREARRRAGLSQRALATRAGVSQPLVARLENGDVGATWDRVLQLVRACGFDLDVRVVPLDEDAWTLGESGQEISPDQRLDRMLEGVRLFEEGERSRDGDDG